MLKYFITKTDDFICHNIKNIFESKEKEYKNNNLEVNALHELSKLDYNPFASTTYESSKFEKDIKLKLITTLGIYFVLLPLIAFLGISYYFHIPYTYAFIITFAVTIFASMRTNIVTSKYLNFRDFISYLN